MSASNCDRLRYAKAFIKPAKRKKVQALHSNTAAVREVVFERDNWMCRIPWCDTTHARPTELAHLQAKGMGGDHGNRTTTENCIVACAEHHRGDRSLHSGHLKYRFLTEAGANGPMCFEMYEELPTEIKTT